MFNLNSKADKQKFLMDMVLGTLVYSVVLGFFNDYTQILQTRSYSFTFFLAIVMQILTYLTFTLKKKVISHFKDKSKKWMVFFVWLIMFISKFVFLAVICFIFKDSVYVSGFWGLLAIILTMTLAKQLIDYAYNKIGNE